MKYKHKNLPFEVEIVNTGITSKAGGNFYKFFPLVENKNPDVGKAQMDLCKNLKSDEDAITYFESIYNDQNWVYALLYMLEQQDYMWNKQNA